MNDMRRHFCWFATNIPEALLVRDDCYNITPMSNAARAFAAKLTADVPDVAQRFAAESDLVEIVFVTDCEKKDDAFEFALRRVRGILDVYSFLTLNPSRLIPVVLIHEDGSAEATAEFFDFESTGRAYIGEAASNTFEDLRRTLVGCLLDAFDIAAMTHTNGDTEVARIVRSAAKMFGHGRRADDVQVQFLCRFTAIEALTCGSVRNGKGALLRSRIPALFGNILTSERVQELWLLRCAASHEGAGGWSKISASLPDVDLIATGCLLFAVAHAKTANTINELWLQVRTYTLPQQLIECSKTRTWLVHRASSVLAKFDASVLKPQTPSADLSET
jgi:hypothetical protein